MQPNEAYSAPDDAAEPYSQPQDSNSSDGKGQVQAMEAARKKANKKAKLAKKGYINDAVDDLPSGARE